ncbi:MAG: glycosyltransferase family 4 protein, partial [Epulopiscium sp.]|nr:glycosyltransferase family 4 protein [Candidatus Epulonipiscium sp.]
MRKLGNEILQEADKVIFLSETYKDKLINRFVKPKNRELISAKSYVIPSGIDEFWLNNVNSVKQLNSDKVIKLLQVGEISKRKNILTTVKSIELLKKNGYDVQFTVVGKIVDNDIYESIKKLDFIKYISPKPQNDLLEIYRENDIFVMPSITETFGLVYPEAMSQGLPLIYTRGQGFDGQLEDG